MTHAYLCESLRNSNNDESVHRHHQSSLTIYDTSIVLKHLSYSVLLAVHNLESIAFQKNKVRSSDALQNIK